MLVIKNIMKGNRSDSKKAVYCASGNNPKTQTLVKIVKLKFHFKIH